MKQQSGKNQKGEIEFRKMLFRQQIDGECIFDDEYDSKNIEKILSERMRKTYKQIGLLKERGVALSPYLEIGAERCQRSLVMENDLEASGAAVDISYDMLKSCAYYKEAFNKSRVPLRVCCDANNLPFMSGSIPFVFCYETLHHFPDPFPIVKEIYRVLSPGGHFFFNDEPYKKILHANLYNAEKLYSNKKINSSKFRKIRNILDIFFSKKTCNEVEHDIVENDDISIKTWKKTLGLFEEKNIKLHSNAIAKNINSDLFYPNNYLKFLLAYFFGGDISGICRKSGSLIKNGISIQDVLICPSCSKKGYESKLSQKNTLLVCRKCGNTYPIIDDVVFLFSQNKLEELYPEISMKTRI
jgi:ubiquinone/menaquinone biosynthesis C-methylase UbiE/uncharacterized protein YbaR (Trm112 family)